MAKIIRFLLSLFLSIILIVATLKIGFIQYLTYFPIAPLYLLFYLIPPLAFMSSTFELIVVIAWTIIFYFLFSIKKENNDIVKIIRGFVLLILLSILLSLLDGTIVKFFPHSIVWFFFHLYLNIFFIIIWIIAAVYLLFRIKNKRKI